MLQENEINVIQIETAIRFGPIIETTVAFLQESPVERLFLGSPYSNTPDYEDKLRRVREFAEQVSEATGVQVMIANSGELA